MWDERYAADHYVYGTEPNAFLAENFTSLPKGKVLCLAEGEGRNAVFLATLGYDVTAVDGSQVGLRKARQLAEQNQVTITTIHADLADFSLGEAQWDGIVSIFGHLPSALRRSVYHQAVNALKPGGVMLLEAYSPAQLTNNTGGPKQADMLVGIDDLHQELSGLQFLHLVEKEREVIEGTFHTGHASVVQMLALKPDDV